MATFDKLSKAEPLSQAENTKRRNDELRQMGTGEEPKKKGETELEYQRRMREQEKKEK